ncbi:MAG: M28 family peptidase [Myxococcota bacterium]
MIDAHAAFARLAAQAALGPRFVGSEGHARVQELLCEWLAAADRVREHAFEAEFFGRQERVVSFTAHCAGNRPGRLLLGTHYDTRPWADRDPDPERRHDPVLGANDGGSGTALLAELIVPLMRDRDRPSIDIVLFDAEDWHEIDGKEVSLGARRFVEALGDAERPDAVVIVDMVAGRDLMLDVDFSCEEHAPSYDLTRELFQLARSLSLPAFEMRKPQPYKWISCDHTPFRDAGIPTALLIDIDYPPWHTIDDTVRHCDAAALAQIGVLLERVIYG